MVKHSPKILASEEKDTHARTHARTQARTHARARHLYEQMQVVLFSILTPCSALGGGGEMEWG